MANEKGKSHCSHRMVFSTNPGGITLKVVCKGDVEAAQMVLETVGFSNKERYVSIPFTANKQDARQFN